MFVSSLKANNKAFKQAKTNQEQPLFKFINLMPDYFV